MTNATFGPLCLLLFVCPSTHSSPHTQTVGPLHSLTVPQQKAALTSKRLQQRLCGLASNSPVVNRLHQHPLILHVTSEAGVHHVCWVDNKGAAGCGSRVCESIWGRKSFYGFHTFVSCSCSSHVVRWKMAFICREVKAHFFSVHMVHFLIWFLL